MRLRVRVGHPAENGDQSCDRDVWIFRRHVCPHGRLLWHPGWSSDRAELGWLIAAVAMGTAAGALIF